MREGQGKEEKRRIKRGKKREQRGKERTLERKKRKDEPLNGFTGMHRRYLCSQKGVGGERDERRRRKEEGKKGRKEEASN